MKRVVIDTNVIVSALLNPQGPSGQILNQVLLDRLALCLDERIWHEYREVLRRPKFGFKAEDIDDVLDYLGAQAYFVNAEPVHYKWPDPSDAKFLEVAIAANAQYLITGNLKHYPSHPIRNIKILAPASFIA